MLLSLPASVSLSDDPPLDFDFFPYFASALAAAFGFDFNLATVFNIGLDVVFPFAFVSGFGFAVVLGAAFVVFAGVTFDFDVDFEVDLADEEEEEEVVDTSSARDEVERDVDEVEAAVAVGSTLPLLEVVFCIMSSFLRFNGRANCTHTI
jgi:hypothetical protein